MSLISYLKAAADLRATYAVGVHWVLVVFWLGPHYPDTGGRYIVAQHIADLEGRSYHCTVLQHNCAALVEGYFSLV